LGKKDKLIERFLARPVDFSFDELTTLLGYFGYTIFSSGKTGGSRVAFTNGTGDYIRLHRPHPQNILKRYQINDIITALQERGAL
jgi:hypothetical protein